MFHPVPSSLPFDHCAETRPALELVTGGGRGGPETISATTTIELAVPNAYVGAILGVQVGSHSSVTPCWRGQSRVLTVWNASLFVAFLVGLQAG